MRSSDYKLVYTPRQGKGVWEMYDPLRDSAELNNLIELGTAPTKELEAMMKELVRWIPADERAQLERLGNRFDVVPNAASSVATPKRGGAAKQHGASVHTDLLRSLGYVQ